MRSLNKQLWVIWDENLCFFIQIKRWTWLLLLSVWTLLPLCVLQVSKVLMSSKFWGSEFAFPTSMKKGGNILMLFCRQLLGRLLFSTKFRHFDKYCRKVISTNLCTHFRVQNESASLIQQSGNTFSTNDSQCQT